MVLIEIEATPTITIYGMNDSFKTDCLWDLNSRCRGLTSSCKLSRLKVKIYDNLYHSEKHSSKVYFLRKVKYFCIVNELIIIQESLFHKNVKSILEKKID